MKVRDLMIKNVVTIGAEDSIKNAIQKMIAGKFRRIPVLADGKLIGIITDRDIRQALNSPVIMHERSYDDYLLNTVKVASSMTYQPLSIGPDEDIHTAAELMEQRMIGGLPVVEGSALVGIITLSDLISFLIRYLREHEAVTESEL